MLKIYTSNIDNCFTRLVDIEKELKNYKSYFKGKVVYCNCDNFYNSNFKKYFMLFFKWLDIKELIVHGYSVNNKKGYLFKMNSQNNTPYIDLSSGNGKYIAGDFRSDLSIELLKQSDIVVTNPPSSLFNEYINQLLFYEKQFIIIGDINFINNKDYFSFFKNNKIGIGYTTPKYFITSYGETQVFKTAVWFTNVGDLSHEPLVLKENYNPIIYPKCDNCNYDAINISRINMIPKDYMGIMRVPISFICKYNKEQFEIIDRDWKLDKVFIKRKIKY